MPIYVEKQCQKNGEEREEINSITPTGWKQKKYNGTYLYNRCHLIGYQLSAENANKKNLITGTRYFNVEGMLPFENQVAEYIKNQKENEDKHVLYRIICFNVFIYNVQPGININYETGESQLIEQ